MIKKTRVLKKNKAYFKINKMLAKTKNKKLSKNDYFAEF